MQSGVRIVRIVRGDANLTAKQRHRLALEVHHRPDAREDFRTESRWGLILAPTLALVGWSKGCCSRTGSTFGENGSERCLGSWCRGVSTWVQGDRLDRRYGDRMKVYSRYGVQMSQPKLGRS